MCKYFYELWKERRAGCCSAFFGRIFKLHNTLSGHEKGKIFHALMNYLVNEFQGVIPTLVMDAELQFAASATRRGLLKTGSPRCSIQQQFGELFFRTL